jgi:GMP synthase (glutamine-hydrolysing)
MEKIIILDFGSQTTQLIGRRLRELNEFCEIVPYNKFPEQTENVKGIILSGSPFSVYDPKAFKIDLNKIRGKFPLLGICYGAQYMVYTAGGKVQPANTREYGRAYLEKIDKKDPLFSNIPIGSQIWMSHSDTITELPSDFVKIASTKDVEIAAFRIKGEKSWGVQFHPKLITLLMACNYLKIF